MKNKWIKIILVASLTFNIAFISKAIYNRAFLKDKTSAEDLTLKTRIALNNDQKEKLSLIMKRFRINLVKSKKDVLEKRIDIIEQLSDPEYDLDILRSKTNELSEIENQLNLTFVETLVEISDVLNSKQRLNFLLNLSENWFFIKQKKNNIKKLK
jgi:Spy/CpxP family protein refolding chaperone